MTFGYLLSPILQIEDVNGLPIVGAKIYVYNADTTNLATVYKDFESHLNTNPVITDDLGNATVIVDDSAYFDIEVRDPNDNLLMGKKNVSCLNGGIEQTDIEAGYGVVVQQAAPYFKISVDTDLIVTQDDLSAYQQKMQGGDNIEITNRNVINVTGRRPIATEYPIIGEVGNESFTIGIASGSYATPEDLTNYLPINQYSADSATFLTDIPYNVIRYENERHSFGTVYQYNLPISEYGVGLVCGSVDLSANDGYIGIFGCSAISDTANIYGLYSAQDVCRLIPTTDYTTVNFVFNDPNKNITNIAIKGNGTSSVLYKNFTCWTM